LSNSPNSTLTLRKPNCLPDRQAFLRFSPTSISATTKLRWSAPCGFRAKFTAETVESLRYDKAIRDEMEWAYTHMGESVYTELKKHKDKVEKHLANNEIKLSPANKTKLLSQEHWNAQLQLMQAAETTGKALWRPAV
jgi:type I restriction enzyme M protein